MTDTTESPTWDSSRYQADRTVRFDWNSLSAWQRIEVSALQRPLRGKTFEMLQHLAFCIPSDVLYELQFLTSSKSIELKNKILNGTVGLQALQYQDGTPLAPLALDFQESTTDYVHIRSQTTN